MREAIRKVISLDFGAGYAQPGDDTVEALPADGKARIALLATSDKLSQHWAPRWLKYAGLEVMVVDTPEKALAEASVSRPNLMIVDAAFQSEESCLLINSLRRVHGEHVPMIALCSNVNDIARATDAAATDIVRRPFDWQIITHRVVQAVKAHEAHKDLVFARERFDHLRDATTAAERDRQRAAGIDTLTGLPKGERFRRLSNNAISALGSEAQTAMIVVGLDRFRTVNESIGFENASRVLAKFADRLKSCISERDIIGNSANGTVTAIAARVGGARFAVQISNGSDDQVERFNEAIAEELSQPFEVDGQSIYLTATLGAAMYPHHCDSADELLHYAETAMLEASQAGIGKHVHDPLRQTIGDDTLKIDSMLREALREEQLELHYQPITDTGTGEVVAAEALLRWDHPTEGQISPGRFVPVAEKTGLMREIGDFVIDEACSQLRDWLDQGMAPIRIAVNLSLCQLLRGDVVKVTAHALARYAIDPSLLEIELSERGVLNKRPEVVNEIRRLKDLGVRISIDDFGTGQAAIAYLKDLPIDVIKIDRSYVSGAERSDRDEAIASGMVALAQRLDATVIAEGVETEDQLEMLKTWGSQECQGFLFSHALPEDEFLKKFG